MDDETILSEIESWPVDERVRLVRDLFDRSPASGEELELTDEMKAELDRRIEKIDRNPEAGVPWESVKARWHSRFSG